MAGEQTISAEELERYRMRLRSMRERMSDEVDGVVESVRAEHDTSSNLSSVPIHLGDIAPEQLDADLQIIEAERAMIEDVQGALHRIDDGTFGKCTDCGAPVARERLRTIPFTPYCIRCASKRG